MKSPYRILFFILLLTARTAFGQGTDGDMRRYRLPARTLPLEKALIKLSEAGANLTYRPSQIPQVTVDAPGGQRTLDRWLDFLLRDTELAYERGAAGYLILPNAGMLSESFDLFGTVTDARTGERLIGATVQLTNEGRGSHTNEYGFYSFPLAGGRHHLRVTYVGYNPVDRELVVASDTMLPIRLHPNRELPQIIVTSASSPLPYGGYFETGTRIGQTEVAQLGGVGGQADPLQLARLLPGVTSGADGVGGAFIRGSEAGHNLILFDGVPIYNLSHAAGLFSLFNNDAIRRIDLHKDALPARFGGRIGGVLDVHTRDGNLFEHELSVGSSLLSTQLTAEGPIRSGESSYLLTGRYFWAGPLLRNFSRRYKADRGRIGETDYRVYDLNFKLNQRVGDRGRLYLSLYSGEDDYRNSSWESDTLLILNQAGALFVNTTPTSRREEVRWENSIGSLRYSHVFSERTFGNFRLSYSNLDTWSTFEHYDSLKEVTNEIFNGSQFSGRYSSAIQQVGAAFDGQHSLGNGRSLRFGAEINRQRFRPQLGSGPESAETLDSMSGSELVRVFRPIQPTAYVDYRGRYGNLYYRLGLRGSVWLADGTHFTSFSPRILLAGPISERSDWQLSYDRTVQPVHLLNSFVIGLPSDLWVPSIRDLPPSVGDQVSGKLTLRPNEDWRVTSSVYYKHLDRLVSYREGGQTSAAWIDELVPGSGRAYGWESILQRSRGKLRGWVGYTLARSDRQFGAEINQGRRFPFRYDRRHSVNLLLIYQVGERTTVTTSWRYESGLAYSLSLETILNPQDFETNQLPITAERNGFRLPAHHRLDVNLHTTLSRPESRFMHTLDVGLYNVYNRRNPLYYQNRPEYFIEDESLKSRTQFFQTYFAPILPSLSYRLTIGSSDRPVFGR